VPTRPGAIPGRRLPPRNGQPLPPRPHTPSRGAFVTRHQQGFTRVRPTSLPLTCGHQTARQPLGFPLSFTPPGHQIPGRMSRRGQVTGTNQGYVSGIAEPPSHNHSQRATSCRNRSQNRTLPIPTPPHRWPVRRVSAPGGSDLGCSRLRRGVALHVPDQHKRALRSPARARIGHGPDRGESSLRRVEAPSVW
jgi:hypothetical protein